MSEFVKQNRSMRAKADASTFLTALKKVSQILRKSSIPVLEGVHICFQDGQCALTGTNMDTWIVAELPAEGDHFACVLSHPEVVEEVCRHFAGSLTLELSETGDEKHHRLIATLSCGVRVAEFDAYPGEDYPDSPAINGDVAFSANAAKLLERVGKVSYAAQKPTQETPAMRSCVQFSGSWVYALDGARAAWDDGTETVPQPFLLYAESLRFLRVFGDAQVEFSFSPPRLFVTDGRTTIIYRMVEGQPFNLEKAIPRTYIETFSVCPQAFLSELHYLKAAAPKTRTLYVYLQGKELLMPVNGKKFKTVLDIERTGDTEIGFNLNYVADALKPFAKVKSVTIKISGSHTPVVIEAEGRSDHALVLPLRNSSAYAAA